jgi:hypothetical protein
LLSHKLHLIYMRLRGSRLCFPRDFIFGLLVMISWRGGTDRLDVARFLLWFEGSFGVLNCLAQPSLSPRSLFRRKVHCRWAFENGGLVEANWTFIFYAEADGCKA